MKVRLHSFNSVFKGSPKQWLLLVLALPYTALQAAEPQFAVPQAHAVWGSPFSAHLELSGMGLDSSSQLNEHCVSSWLEPVQIGSTSPTSNGVRVKYSRISGDRGLFNFSSETHLREPVVRLVLESRCPLVEFSRAWVFQVDISASPDSGGLKTIEEPSPRRGTWGGELTKFEPKTSSELLNSFNRPRVLHRNSPAPQALAVSVPAKGSVLPVAQATQAASPESDSQERGGMIHSPDTVALNGGGVMSTKGPEALSSDGHAEQPLPLDADRGWMATVELTVAVLTLLLVCSGLWWMRRRQWFGLGQGLLDAAKIKAATSTPANHHHSRLWMSEDLESESTRDSEVTGEDLASLSQGQGRDSDAMSKQLFESLLGVSKAKDLMADLSSDKGDIAARLARRSPSEQLIHKVSLGPWALPESYNPLLPGHLVKSNQSDNPETAGLHLELNLIEFAFLVAQEHRLLDEGVVDRMIEAHADQFRASAFKEGSSHEPSDLIRDFLRARACEFKNREDLKEFQSALLRMAEFSACKSYCMGHPSWADCVQDLTLG